MTEPDDDATEIPAPGDDDGPVLDPVDPREEKPWDRPSARNRRIIATASMIGVAALAFATGLFVFNNACRISPT
jgi:hypothetical protein